MGTTTVAYTTMDTTRVGMLANDLTSEFTSFEKTLPGNSTARIDARRDSAMVKGRDIDTSRREPRMDGAIPPSSLESGEGGVSVKNPAPALRTTDSPLETTTKSRWKSGAMPAIDKATKDAVKTLSFKSLLDKDSRPPLAH
ncbi:MAG: hypothetical protein QXP68_03050 [Thermosphaera sp.]